MAYVNNQISSGQLIQGPFASNKVSVYADPPGPLIQGNNTQQTVWVHVGLQGVAGYTDICGGYQVQENLPA
ncbi:hypothetical protein ABTE17_20505, partial [Acinetobacter baumannii]